MADEILETIQTQETAQIPQELAEQMAIALNNGIVPQEQAQEVNNQEAGAPAENGAVVVQDTPVFTFDTLKEQFGYEKPEDVLAEIKSFRELKENPVKAEIKFENDESEKLFKAIQAGKKEEVYAILAEQNRLEKLTSQEVTKESAADIIKLGMQLKYKDLTPEEINYKFNKQFALPKQPIQDTVNESDEDYEVRLNEWKEQVSDIEMNKIIEAKLIKPELEGAKSKIVLPELENTLDEGYLNYQKMIQETAQLEELSKEAYKTITPKDVQTKVPFTDEASNVKFEFVYEPDSESFKQAVEIASDNEKFFSTFLNSDGSPNRQLWVDAIHYALNKKLVITEAIKQGSNARMKAQLPDNESGGLVRHLPQEQGINELDAAMQAAGIKVGR